MRPRRSIGALLIVVALAALLAGVEAGRRRATLYQRRAEQHAAAARRAAAMADDTMIMALTTPDLFRNYRQLGGLTMLRRDGDHLRPVDDADVLDEFSANAARWNACARHHDALRRKYEGAGRAVWRSVEPDPPAPAEPPDMIIRRPPREGPFARPTHGN